MKILLNLPNQANCSIIQNECSLPNIYIQGPYAIFFLRIPIFLKITLEKDKCIVEAPNECFEIFQLFVLQLKQVLKTTLLMSVRRLFLKGVGFKFFFNKEKNYLIVNAGFSHLKAIKIPFNTFFQIRNEKNTMLKITNSSKVRISTIAQQIQTLKYPDSYKGKGIHIDGVVLKLKEGKKQK